MALSLEGMISVAEAARWLGRSQERVRRYLREGKLRGHRVGGQWFVEERSVGRLLNLRSAPKRDLAHINAFRIDLAEIEGTFQADVAVYKTPSADLKQGYPPGIIVSADRGAHGAEVHLTWEQAEAFRAELDRLLRKAKRKT